MPTGAKWIAGVAVVAVACAFSAPAQAAPSVLPASASSAAVVDPCPPEAAGAVCGHVEVPRDRRDPAAGMFSIAFELYPHSEPGRAESVVIPNLGGPGFSPIAERDFVKLVFPAPLERRDLLLIDARGRGRSGVIDCADLQHGAGPLVDASAACARQLGADVTRYSTADVAQDYEAVRRALGYEAVDFFGLSYGGVEASAYATRFGDRLRSVVLDSPLGPTTLDPFDRLDWMVDGELGMVAAICERSRLCGRSRGRAIREIGWLVRRVQREPIGAIDPAFVFSNMLDVPPGIVLSLGEIPAAVTALRRGDRVALLRLAAEADRPIPGDAGDPVVNSQGVFAATLCVDAPAPWSPEAALPERRAQFAAAVRSAPDARFAPFDAQDVMFTARSAADHCLPWPQTGSRPPVDPGAEHPDVPTLVLSGDLDRIVSLEMARETAGHYDDARLVEVAGAGHGSVFDSPCALGLVTEFVETLDLRGTSCADRVPMHQPSVADFPRRASESGPAEPHPGNQAHKELLRVARVAGDTALDAIRRPARGDSIGAGLRGGTWARRDEGATFSLRFSGTRFTEDVAVSGQLTASASGDRVDAELHVDGPGDRDGTLHLTGDLWAPDAARTITITGTLAGKTVAAEMPSI